MEKYTQTSSYEDLSAIAFCTSPTDMDCFQDLKDKSQNEIIDNILKIQAIKKTLDLLTPREKTVICLRYGIQCSHDTKKLSNTYGHDHTLEEIGKKYSVHRERIRQIEAKALRKLRHPSRSKFLRSFICNSITETQCSKCHGEKFVPELQFDSCSNGVIVEMIICENCNGYGSFFE